MTELQAYVAHLEELVALAEAGRFETINTSYGVCFATCGITTSQINAAVICKTTTWEHYSGDVDYPIPVTSSIYGHSSVQYYETKNLWRGEQLTMRISYMKHLIKELS